MAFAKTKARRQLKAFDKAIRNRPHLSMPVATTSSLMPGDRLAIKISMFWQPCTAVDASGHVALDAGLHVQCEPSDGGMYLNVLELPEPFDPLSAAQRQHKRWMMWTGLTDDAQGESLLAIFRQSGVDGLTAFKSRFWVGSASRLMSTYGALGDFQDQLYTYLGGSWRTHPVPGGDEVRVWDSDLSTVVRRHDAHGEAMAWNGMFQQLDAIQTEQVKDQEKYKRPRSLREIKQRPFDDGGLDR